MPHVRALRVVRATAAACATRAVLPSQGELCGPAQHKRARVGAMALERSRRHLPVLVVKWLAPREERVERDADGPKVDRRLVRPALLGVEQLRGHVRERAVAAVDRLGALFDLARKAKVDELGLGAGEAVLVPARAGDRG
eukprot:562626-Pleurochrysis_carterae.AAC.1